VKLYRARRRHKIASVLLHEIGHTFGVPHETERTSVMHRSYDAKASGFGPAAVGAMRMGLAREVDPSSSPNAAFAEAFIAHLTRTSSAWIPADRDEMIALLEKLRAAGAVASAAASAAAPPRPAASAAAVSSPTRFGASESEPVAPAGRVPAIAAEHRAPFERAQQLLRDGQVDEAWSTAKPLFDTYPQDHAVQDLRCQIAMKRTSAWAQTQRECEPLMRLARPAKPKGGREQK
jgi:predicted Zn-dependent protease